MKLFSPTSKYKTPSSRLSPTTAALLASDKPTFSLSVRLLRILNVLIREFYASLVRSIAAYMNMWQQTKLVKASNVVPYLTASISSVESNSKKATTFLCSISSYLFFLLLFLPLSVSLIVLTFSFFLPLQITQCEIFLSMLVKFLDSDKPLWQRTLAVEVLHSFCNQPNLLRSKNSTKCMLYIA